MLANGICKTRDCFFVVDLIAHHFATFPTESASLEKQRIRCIHRSPADCTKKRSPPILLHRTTQPQSHEPHRLFHRLNHRFQLRFSFLGITTANIDVRASKAPQHIMTVMEYEVPQSQGRAPSPFAIAFDVRCRVDTTHHHRSV